jgi:glycosyltransferase involved in cell wall biosynthesis
MLTRSLERHGGIEAHVLDAAGLLRAVGHEVLVLAQAVGEQGDAVPVEGLAAPQIPAAGLRALQGALADFRPDVIHTHDLRNAGAAMAAYPGAASAMSIHAYTGCITGQKYFKPGHECNKPLGPLCFPAAVFAGCSHRKVPRPSPRHYRVSKRQVATARRVDACVVYSHHMRDHMRRNGVDDPIVLPFSVESPAALKPLPRTGTLLFSGRVVDSKGLDVVVRALPRLPQIRLKVAGEGWALAKVQAAAEKLGVSDRIDYLGWLAPDDLAAVHAEVDLVVVPSVWPEPFGLIGIEALSHGRPVVASDTGGIRDWAIPGETGWLFRPGSDEDLARRVAEAVSDYGRLEELGKRGAAFVRERFSPAVFAGRSSQLYDAISAGRGAALL